MEPSLIGILLVNLGTPDSPGVSDVRRYLRQFLLDPRVIDIPTLPRNLLVRGIIAPFRGPKSAQTYQKIWTQEGSPLMVHSLRQKQLLQQELGPNYMVELAMRYQNPSIPKALAQFKGKALAKLKVIPLFPQYASATTGSVMEAVMRELATWPTIPPLELVNSYPTQPLMIQAFADRGRPFHPDTADHILFSYHGLPQRQLQKSDSHSHCLQSPSCCELLTEKNAYCYSAQCHATSKAIAAALGLPKEKWTTTFQSRLGKAEWTRPYTSDLIHSLPKQGQKKVLVFTPAFTSDCLETLFEIGEEYAEEFQRAGGETLSLVPSLNDHPLWIQSLAALAK